MAHVTFVTDHRPSGRSAGLLPRRIMDIFGFSLAELGTAIAEARRDSRSLNGVVVGTVMTNIGLEHALAARGIKLERAQVGDRYVLEMMQRGGWPLGGETSGHIICLDRMTTGDGIVAALQVIAATIGSGKSLNEMKKGMVKHPQLIGTVRAGGRGAR